VKLLAIRKKRQRNLHLPAPIFLSELRCEIPPRKSFKLTISPSIKTFLSQATGEEQTQGALLSLRKQKKFSHKFSIWFYQ
jgi:hypothetical protein